MKRFTKRSGEMIWFVNPENHLKYEPCEMDSHCCRLVLEKLADYEDIERQKIIDDDNVNEIAQTIDKVFYELRDLLEADDVKGKDAIYDFRSALYDAFGIYDLRHTGIYNVED